MDILFYFEIDQIFVLRLYSTLFFFFSISFLKCFLDLQKIKFPQKIVFIFYNQLNSKDEILEMSKKVLHVF